MAFGVWQKCRFGTPFATFIFLQNYSRKTFLIPAFFRQSLLNVKAILEEAGTSMANVVKTTVFMADMGDFAEMNSVYAEFFTEPYPARSAVAVKTLPKNALVEIEVVAKK